jgi:hypothetical protein
MRSIFICLAATVCFIQTGICENYKWQPEGCPIAVPFPSKPSEKISTVGSETVYVAILHLNADASIGASFRNISTSELPKDKQFEAMQLLAESFVKSNGLAEVQYDREVVPLGNRLTMRTVKTMTVNNESKKVQFIADWYILSHGILSIRLTNNLNYTGFETMKFRHDVSRLIGK